MSFLDDWLGIDGPNEGLTMEAAEGLAGANVRAGQLMHDAAEDNIGFWDNVHSSNQDLYNPFLSYRQQGQDILSSDLMRPDGSPVNTEADVSRYMGQATDWQNRALAEHGVPLTHDQTIDRGQFGQTLNRGQSAKFGGRQALQNRAPNLDPTMRTNLRHGSYEDFDRSSVNLEEDPGYQFRLQEGEKAIRRAANAGSGARTGSTFKALQAHGQGLAAQEYQAAYDRALQQYATNRQNRFRETDDQFSRDAFNRQSQMRDQDIAYRGAEFDRATDMRNQGCCVAGLHDQSDNRADECRPSDAGLCCQPANLPDECRYSIAGLYDQQGYLGAESEQRGTAGRPLFSDGRMGTKRAAWTE